MILATGVGTSTGAYTKSANLLTGRNQFLQKGQIIVYARGSATGMNISVCVGGISIMDDQSIPFFGTSGALSKKDHEVFSQVINGGTAEVYLRNTTAGSLTTDYIVEFIPMK
jgi:uncharacterized protein GlcG (DUF336 family)